MNRFVKTALAIAVAGSAANAGTGDNEWAALDSEISGLASSLRPSQDSMGWAVLLRTVYSNSSDDIATGGVGDDLSGFNFKDVDLAFWGNSGAFMYRVSADIDNSEGGLAATGTDLVLEDAYVRWNCGDYFNAKMGQFKPKILQSGSVDPGNLLFINRTVLGSAADFWDNGIGANGSWEQVSWHLAMLNGVDGHMQDYGYVARVEWMMNEGAGEIEGGSGSTDVLNGTIGFTWVHDDSFGASSGAVAAGDADDTDAFILDVNGSVSNFGFGFEIAQTGDTFAAITDEDFSNLFVPLIVDVDSQPWSLTGSYVINPEWEVAARYEDLDNSENGDDNTILSLGANWRRDGGKWQIQWSDFDGDTLDGSVIEVGYAIGQSR